MKYLIVSDSHRYHGNLIKIMQRVSPVAAIIHLGDLQCSLKDFKDMIGCPVYAVAGNGDSSCDLDEEQVVMIEGHRIAMCHGHRQGVNFGLERLVFWGMEKEAEIVMFGHTHIPLLAYEKGMTLINPGSISLPRQEPRIPTFAVMEIDKKGEVHFTMNRFC